MPSTNDKLSHESALSAKGAIKIGDWQITIEQHCGQFIAQMDDDENIYSWGITRAEAIGSVARDMAERGII